MDVREELVELLTEFYGCDPMYYDVDAWAIADHLIAHGVTVQEWISVDDRLPEEDDYYLCCIKSSLFPDRIYIDILECDKGSFEEGLIYTDTVTHWMPMPQPPKGE